MPSKKIYRGQWWLAFQDPSQAVFGALTIEEDGRLELALHGSFDIWVRSEQQCAPGAVKADSQRSSFDLIYGEVGGLRFTLINNIIGRTSLSPGRGTQTLQPQRALSGEQFLPSIDAPVIEAVYLRVDHLTFFSQLSGFEFKDLNLVDGQISSSATYTPTKALVAECCNATIQLGLESKDFYPDRSGPDGNTLSATERAFFDVTFAEPVTLAEADQTASRLQDMVTLALNRPCGGRNLRYRLPTPPPVDDWERERATYADRFNTTAHGRRLYKSSDQAVTDLRSSFLFTLSDLPFSEVLPRWLATYEKATTGIQMFLGTRYLNVGYVTSRLISIAAALESIHTGLYNRPAMEESRYDELYALLMKAIPEGRDRQFVREHMNNRMPFKERALDLAARLPEGVAEQLLSDVNEWAKRLRDSRDYVAHALDTRRGEPAVGLDLFLMLITQCLLHIVLAIELGLKQEQVTLFVERSWGLTARFEEILNEAKADPG